MSTRFVIKKSYTSFMPNNLIIMNKVRHILRLYTQGVSKKQISEKTDVTRNTAKKYIRKFIALEKPL